LLSEASPGQKCETLPEKITRAKNKIKSQELGAYIDEVVECLPSKCVARSSSPSMQKKKKKKKQS
jgi:hypothetical protein